jgi:putative acyl-CoA dehydrogenase
MTNATATSAPASDRYGAVTHDVLNQPFELADYNLYNTDIPLTEAVMREGAGWAANDLAEFGARIGTAGYLELGVLANKHLP